MRAFYAPGSTVLGRTCALHRYSTRSFGPFLLTCDLCRRCVDISYRTGICQILAQTPARIGQASVDHMPRSLTPCSMRNPDNIGCLLSTSHLGPAGMERAQSRLKQSAASYFPWEAGARRCKSCPFRLAALGNGPTSYWLWRGGG